MQAHTVNRPTSDPFWLTIDGELIDCGAFDRRKQIKFHHSIQFGTFCIAVNICMAASAPEYREKNCEQKKRSPSFPVSHMCVF
jgi:hypothetical protein